ncbi:hypothetical protein THAOC_16463 [Thalassiosira oceanica]|uniref:Uncharacterized protein n=1 Tax=Thalassiosira oceanica TaxID=159749 RepID=K0SC26_THAOC|nr:hypothetical protein THAOC_16463 [Thalassiosira oceanica]|eukprot:EJK62905.1 hypothetical protein THAOC_16463 [Thalassiosira oceanica]
MGSYVAKLLFRITPRSHQLPGIMSPSLCSRQRRRDPVLYVRSIGLEAALPSLLCLHWTCPSKRAIVSVVDMATPNRTAQRADEQQPLSPSHRGRSRTGARKLSGSRRCCRRKGEDDVPPNMTPVCDLEGSRESRRDAGPTYDRRRPTAPMPRVVDVLSPPQTAYAWISSTQRVYVSAVFPCPVKVLIRLPCALERARKGGVPVLLAGARGVPRHLRTEKGYVPCKYTSCCVCPGPITGNECRTEWKMMTSTMIVLYYATPECSQSHAIGESARSARICQALSSGPKIVDEAIRVTTEGGKTCWAEDLSEEVQAKSCKRRAVISPRIAMPPAERSLTQKEGRLIEKIEQNDMVEKPDLARSQEATDPIVLEAESGKDSRHVDGGALDIGALALGVLRAEGNREAIF